jgi:aminomethyltransferase
MVVFAGWDMPLHYGSQLDEHHAVRRDAGVFDVSHMRAIDVAGNGATDYLRHLLANDVVKLGPGGALYSCLLNESGGIQDDLIVHRLDAQRYRLVVNAATTARDVAWLAAHRPPPQVTVVDRGDLAILSVQGPRAREHVAGLLASADGTRVLALAAFHGLDVDYAGTQAYCSRTGYTGEDGFEILVAATRVGTLWDALVAAGVRPCGLGARDTLRLEAGLNLYGSDMDEQTTPLECGLAWTVTWDPERDFVGRRALQTQLRAGVQHALVGLVLEERGVLRAHQRVITAGGDGETTSGSYSPTLERGIALARVPVATAGRVQVQLRDRLLAARVVKPPFVRHGRACVGLGGESAN